MAEEPDGVALQRELDGTLDIAITEEERDDAVKEELNGTMIEEELDGAVEEELNGTII